MDQHDIEILYKHLGIMPAPEHLREKFKPIDDDGKFALFQFMTRLEDVKRLDSRLKPEIAMKERSSQILEARRMVFSFLRKPLHKAQMDLAQAKGEFWAATAPPKLAKDDSVGAIREMEIRNMMRGKDHEEKIFLLSDSLERGDLSILHACISAPDPILSKESLDRIRRDYTEKHFPERVEKLKSAERDYGDIRNRCAQIAGASVSALVAEGIDDPLPMEEHLEVFPAQSKKESNLWGKRIQKRDSDADAKKRREEWEAKNRGTNFQGTPRASLRGAHNQ